MPQQSEALKSNSSPIAHTLLHKLDANDQIFLENLTMVLLFEQSKGLLPEITGFLLLSHTNVSLK